MNRQLTCSLTESDSAETLVQELMYFGFIHEVSANSLIESGNSPVKNHTDRIILFYPILQLILVSHFQFSLEIYFYFFIILLPDSVL